MVLHRVCAAHEEIERKTLLYDSLTNCFTIPSHLGIGVQKKREQRKGRRDYRRVSLVTIQSFVWEKKQFAQMFTDRLTDDGRRMTAYSSPRLRMS